MSNVVWVARRVWEGMGSDIMGVYRTVDDAMASCEGFGGDFHVVDGYVLDSGDSLADSLCRERLKRSPEFGEWR